MWPQYARARLSLEKMQEKQRRLYILGRSPCYLMYGSEHKRINFNMGRSSFPKPTRWWLLRLSSQLFFSINPNHSLFISLYPLWICEAFTGIEQNWIAGVLWFHTNTVKNELNNILWWSRRPFSSCSNSICCSQRLMSLRKTCFMTLLECPHLSYDNLILSV